MPTIWALSDLHLSTSGSKPMDVFGEHWDAHDQQMAQHWDKLVQDDDIVLTPGDFSWAMKPADAAGDLAWLAQRPGTKLMVKGNHDYWWPGTRKQIDALMPPRTKALKKTAAIVDGVGFFGARGGDFAPLTRYGDKRTQADVDAWLDREEAELRASLLHLEQLEAAQGKRCALRICLFHYPPIAPGRRDSRFHRIIRDAGAKHCVYGHLHGRQVSDARVEGDIDGVQYRCASCDLIAFTPVVIERI